MAQIGTVDQLWRFPVKSMLGERMDQVEVTERGVLGDRAYALLDVTDGKVVSAKNPRKWGQVLELSAAFVEPPTAAAPTPPVLVTMPDGSSVRSDEPGGRTDAMLSAFLGRPVHLTAEAPTTTTMEETWPDDVDGVAPESFIDSTRIETGDPDETVSDITMAMAAPKDTFFDLASLHLMTDATLVELRRRSPSGDFDVRRYRPNVVVAADGVGFVENDWEGRRLGLGTGGAVADVSIPTMRCIMTTLAQPGLDRDASLLRTIAAHNRRTIFGGQWACAGVYAGVAGTGTVSVGDPVTLD